MAQAPKNPIFGCFSWGKRYLLPLREHTDCVMQIVVEHSEALRGEVQVPGAKNSVLKLMAASLLAVGKTTISNVPDIADVDIMADLLTRLGCTVHLNNKDGGDSTVTIDVPAEPLHRADYELVRKMRASINVLGPLVARIGIAEVALPGGDAIGSVSYTHLTLPTNREV